MAPEHDVGIVAQFLNSSLLAAFGKKAARYSGDIGEIYAILSLARAQLGRDDVPLYDGSWAEWGADTHTPVATGPAE